MGVCTARPKNLPAAVALVALMASCTAGPVVPDAAFGTYIVQLTAPALVSYGGGIDGLAPTSPQTYGASGVDLTTPACQAYLAYLKKQQGQLITIMTGVLGRPVTPVHNYYYALDGFAVRLTSMEAAYVAQIQGVSSVHPDSAYRTLAPDEARPTNSPLD